MCKYQCSFRKGHKSKHALISLFEKWLNNVDQGLNNVDQGRILGALLTDLSKVFDYLPHNMVFPKLYAYGFDIKALGLYTFI